MNQQTTHPVELHIQHSALADDKQRPHPLLFIHGFSAGAWMFEQQYVPYFNRLGYETFTVDLRGHGQSGGKTQLKQTSLEDFLADVAYTVSQIKQQTGTLPILVGHSMGGVLTQLYAAANPLPAAVILRMGDISVGMPSFMMWLMRQFPWLSIKMMVSGNSDAMFTRAAVHDAIMFAQDIKWPSKHDAINRLVNQPASDTVFQDLRQLKSIRPASRIPTLAVVGEQDPIASTKALSSLAENFAADIVIVPNLRHDLMVNPNWKQPASHIAQWLDNQGF